MSHHWPVNHHYQATNHGRNKSSTKLQWSSWASSCYRSICAKRPNRFHSMTLHPVSGRTPKTIHNHCWTLKPPVEMVDTDRSMRRSFTIDKPFFANTTITINAWLHHNRSFFEADAKVRSGETCGGGPALATSPASSNLQPDGAVHVSRANWWWWWTIIVVHLMWLTLVLCG